MCIFLRRRKDEGKKKRVKKRPLRQLQRLIQKSDIYTLLQPSKDFQGTIYILYKKGWIGM